MKKEDLFQAMNDIDDSFLDENVTEIRYSPWISVVIGAAACVAVTIGVLYALPKPMTDEISMEKITVQNTETTQTEAITEAVPLAECKQKKEDYRLYLSVPADAPEIRSVYDTYCLKDDEENWPIFAEIEIDEELGHVSLMTAYDSRSLPHVGNLVKTDTGYDCQINGTDFTLEYYEAPLECLAEPLEESQMPLIFHAQNHPLDGMIFTSQIMPYQPFADIQAEAIEHLTFRMIHDTEEAAVNFTLLEQYQSGTSETFLNLLRHAEILTPTLCHEMPETYFTFKYNEEEYQIAVTTNYFIINDRLYHATPETLKTLNEFCLECKDIRNAGFLRELMPPISMDSDIIQTTTVTSETVIQTTVTTSAAEETVIVSVPVDGQENGVIHLPNITDENTTQSEPVFIDEKAEHIQTDEPHQPEPDPIQPPELPAETAVSSMEETPAITDVDEIPPEVLNSLTEIEGVIYSVEDEPHIEIEPTQGIYKELYLSWATKFYPDKQYAVQIHMHTGTDNTPEEKQQLLQDSGIHVTGIYEYDRIQAIVTSADLDMLQQYQEYGFLIDLLPCSAKEIHTTETIPQ